MTENEIRRCINDGALTLFNSLGNAEHMERIDCDRYSLIQPKEGEQGDHTVFNIRLEDLSDNEALKTIQEVRDMGHHWWNIDCSDRIYKLIWGHDRQPIQEAGDTEWCMALLPSEKTKWQASFEGITVKKVNNPESFALWANIVNYILENGYRLFHPKNHYHLCKSGVMDCYIGFYKGIPAAVVSTLHKDDTAALYELGTLECFRKKGLARALSTIAIEEAFKSGSRIAVAVVWPDAKPLADSLGFKAY